MPALQVCPIAHTRPHIPQLFRSVCVFTHTEGIPQAVCPEGHTQRPAEQLCPVGHALPQAPQFALSICVLTQTAGIPQAI